MYILALFVTTTAATYFYNREQDRRRAFYQQKIKELKRIWLSPIKSALKYIATC